jgi:hypothetical protein
MSIRPYLTGLPNEMVKHIFGFLGDPRKPTPPENDQSILATARVCRAWKDNALLMEARGSARDRIRDDRAAAAYPEAFRRVFRGAGYFLSRFPLLNLEGRIGETGYINFLTPGDLGGVGSVVRFKDRIGRPGFALSLERRADPSDRAVIAVFKRYYRQTDLDWRYAGGEHMRVAIIEHHGSTNPRHVQERVERCPDCPFLGGRGVNPTFLASVLNGTHPLVRLTAQPTLLPPSGEAGEAGEARGAEEAGPA